MVRVNKIGRKSPLSDDAWRQILCLLLSMGWQIVYILATIPCLRGYMNWMFSWYSSVVWSLLFLYSLNDIHLVRSLCSSFYLLPASFFPVLIKFMIYNDVSKFSLDCSCYKLWHCAILTFRVLKIPKSGYYFTATKKLNTINGCCTEIAFVSWQVLKIEC